MRDQVATGDGLPFGVGADFVAGGDENRHDVHLHILGADEFGDNLAGAGGVKDDVDAGRSQTVAALGAERVYQLAEFAYDFDVFGSERDPFESAEG